MNGNEVIHFWFEEIESRLRFANDPEFDQLIASRFLSLHEQARHGELFEWREHPLGALAEIILLDQFSRNLFRGQREAFAFDSQALVLAQEAIRRGYDRQLEPGKKAFLYMPFMHSESAKIHEIALQLFAQPGLEGNYNYELRHKAIIDRFGRYPHRNTILGRESTAQEIEFLTQPGSSF